MHRQQLLSNVSTTAASPLVRGSYHWHDKQIVWLVLRGVQCYAHLHTSEPGWSSLAQTAPTLPSEQELHHRHNETSRRCNMRLNYNSIRCLVTCTSGYVTNMTATAQNCKLQNVLNKYIYNNHHLSVVRLLWRVHRDSEKRSPLPRVLTVT